MKAIRVHEFGGPEVLRLEDVPELRPDSSQLLVRLAAAGVNPVDTYKRAAAAHSPAPYTPARTERAGRGAGAGDKFKAGDRGYLADVTGTTPAALRGVAGQPLPRTSVRKGACIGVPYTDGPPRALPPRRRARADLLVTARAARRTRGRALAAPPACPSRHAGTDEGPPSRRTRPPTSSTTLRRYRRFGGVAVGRGVDVIVECGARELDRDLAAGEVLAASSWWATAPRRDRPRQL